VPGQPPSQIAAGGDRFSVVADTRTNSILLRSDNPGRIEQLRTLIAKLDVPARAMGSTHVIYLRHAEATKLVEVLRGMLTAQPGAVPGGAPTTAGVIPGRPGVASGAAGAVPSLIQADEATNSIIINASDTVYNSLRIVIEQLDIRRAQVYVEALIAEMNADRTDELGFQWAGVTGVGQASVGGFTNFLGASPSLAATVVSPATAAATANGLTVAVLGKSITLPNGTTVQSLGALARALTSNQLGNILSTPNLLTLDNYQAKIVVGQNVPFVTGSFTTAATVATPTAGAVNPFQTIERKDVGLTLRIKPQISEGSTVRLEIYQEVSDIAPSLLTGASDLITNKRSIETKVIVDDGATIVLGGLIQNTLNETTQGVPFLSEIPILGALFRFKSQEKKRTNLMIFLRPIIIRAPEDAYRVTVDRYEYLRGYTRGEGPEREGIYDRLEPTPPTTPTPPRPSSAPLAPPPQAAPVQPPAAPPATPLAPPPAPPAAQ
jgi:general secretion pathway protein D